MSDYGPGSSSSEQVPSAVQRGLIHTFDGQTTSAQRLSFELPKGVTARYVQVRITQSPTWISWWEVEIRIDPPAADR